MPADAIVIDRVSRRYGAVQAVRDLSLGVAAGEMFGLIGPDGAGKTTTIRMICGMLCADSGSIRVLSFDPVRQHRAVTAKMLAYQGWAGSLTLAAAQAWSMTAGPLMNGSSTGWPGLLRSSMV